MAKPLTGIDVYDEHEENVVVRTNANVSDFDASLQQAPDALFGRDIRVYTVLRTANTRQIELDQYIDDAGVRRKIVDIRRDDHHLNLTAERK